MHEITSYSTFAYIVRLGLNQEKTETESSRQGIGLLNTIKSTLAAACGVQTKSNRERDFEHAKPSTFIIAGVVFVVVFIFGMYGVVQLVLSL